MKIGLAQINTIVGDIAGNSRKIVDFADRARTEGADLVVFPEMTVTGYPPLDLLDSSAFIDASEASIAWITDHLPSGIGAIIGAPTRNRKETGKRLFNSAFLIEEGMQPQRVDKMLLPTYDVFDEYRHFEPATKQRAVTFRGMRLGLNVCEDMWNHEDYSEYHTYERDPLEELAAAGVDLFVNISASPFSTGKHALRNSFMPEICKRTGIPFVLVNLVGANTEVLFDGDSRVHGADGSLFCCAPSFEEALLVWDTNDTRICNPPRQTDIGNLHDALVLGIRDYFHKTSAFNKALIGLSGGIDSAVTCALAVEAVGKDKVVGITLPSRHSSTGSVSDSRELARNLGIEFHDVSIRPAVDAFDTMLNPLFAGTESGVTEENVQARARGLALMAVSNKFGYLLLSTGNKSEISMGYATLYGDMSGGLSVISDVFKTQVFELARHINERAETDLIPENTITKPPSAELRPDQKDEDSLPPYAILDEVLRRYVELRQDVEVIAAATGHDHDFVFKIIQTVDRNEFKRRQAPPGLRVSGKAFGIGRRVPIVMRYDRNEIDRMFDGARSRAKP